MTSAEATRIQDQLTDLDQKIDDNAAKAPRRDWQRLGALGLTMLGMAATFLIWLGPQLFVTVSSHAAEQRVNDKAHVSMEKDINHNTKQLDKIEATGAETRGNVLLLLGRFNIPPVPNNTLGQQP